MRAVDVGRTGKVRAAETVCTEAPGSNPEYFVEIDLHKKFMQGAIMDSGGMVLQNRRAECDPKDVVKEFSKLPANSRCVPESSSVWYGMYRFLGDFFEKSDEL